MDGQGVRYRCATKQLKVSKRSKGVNGNVAMSSKHRNYYGYRGNNKCGLILQQTLVKEVLCQKYKKGPTSESVYRAAKQFHLALMK